MKEYKVSQKLLSIGAVYEVFEGDATEAKVTVKGKVLTFSPKLEVFEGETLIGKMTGNYFKTKFEITDAAGSNLGTITFPFFAFMKGFTLDTKGKTYSAKGGFLARNFACKDEAGRDVITVAKEFALKDKFNVGVDESIDDIVGILSAISIDQRFFQDKG